MPTNIETDAQFTWEKNALFALVTKAPLLNDNGSIIFNGSVHNYLGQPGQAAYAATKGGLVSMARSIAADLAPRNIRVNVVAPGATKTPIGKRGPRASMSTDESAKLVRFVSSVIPLGRWGEPEELAKAVLFLASEDSSYVNARGGIRSAAAVDEEKSAARGPSNWHLGYSSESDNC